MLCIRQFAAQHACGEAQNAPIVMRCVHAVMSTHEHKIGTLVAKSNDTQMDVQ
jgi:hypothetical protein